jgi:hypothetical protein
MNCRCEPGCQIEAGKCHCGCGGIPPLAKKTRNDLRHRRGFPVRFINGHGKKISSSRFEFVDMGYTSPCWIWNGPVNKSGYGRTRDGNKQIAVHRREYEKANGPIPKGKDLDHLCRVRRCANPAHLEPVTEAENVRRAKTCKLTALKVEQIKAQAASGRQRGLIARDFVVSETTVRDILSGRTWRAA